MKPEEVRSWRSARRHELLQMRLELSAVQLASFRARIDTHIQRSFPDLVHEVIGFCWPYKSEYDARHLLAELRRKGAVTAMPAIVAPRSPLVFREWHPGVHLEKGPLGIPFPVCSRELPPDSVLLPVVGFDLGGYRLGYGGAYFDITLAAASKRPRLIGVGYEFQCLETIYPQPHDVPLDWIVTERGVYRRDADRLRFLDDVLGYSSPPCLAAELAPGYFGEDLKRR